MTPTPNCDILRSIVTDKNDLPYMTVIIHRDEANIFRALQPEFGIIEEAECMDEAILRVADSMWQLISSEEYDYLQTGEEGTSYYVPIPILPEEYASDRAGLVELLNEAFSLNTVTESDRIFFASAAPEPKKT